MGNILKNIFIVGLALSSFFVVSASHAEVLFRIHGSNTVGAELAPALIRQYLQQELKAKNIKYVVSKVEYEGIITGETSNGPVAVEIWAHGSSTAFRDLKANKADIGMA